VNVRKPPGWHGNVRSLQVHMAVDLATLAEQAGAGKRRHKHTHLGPAKVSADKTACCPDTWVVNAMHGLTDALAEGGRHKGPEHPGCDVPEE
jgi:hypothetical protein